MSIHSAVTELVIRTGAPGEIAHGSLDSVLTIHIMVNTLLFHQGLQTSGYHGVDNV